MARRMTPEQIRAMHARKASQGEVPKIRGGTQMPHTETKSKELPSVQVNKKKIEGEHKIVIKSLLQGIYLDDAEFSEAFKKIDAEIDKETNDLDRKVLENLKNQGCAWVDYKHAFGYDDELMLDVYNATRKEGSKFKYVINQAIQTKYKT